MARGSETGRVTVAGVSVSHPHRLIYPSLSYSKLDLARYYEGLGEWIVPHVRGRPLTLVHCPEGVDGPCRYLKHAKAWGPSALRRVRIQEKTKVGEYLVADSIAAVVALAQMGIVEIHTWNSTIDDVERPNRLVWDLDPGPLVAWRETVDAARLLRHVLQTLGLESWVKTTGGKGLHVVVPIARSLDWSECLAFTRHVSEIIVRANPALYTTAFSKQGRERQILFDYLRNNRTNTSVCAFSARARATAAVSVPLAWDELPARLPRWTVKTVVRRVARLARDPWEGYWHASQRVSQRARQAVAG
jgi:bifunctional non-homologous end joining protein LigD